MMRPLAVLLLVLIAGCAAQQAARHARRQNLIQKAVERLNQINYDSTQRPPVADNSAFSTITVLITIFINRIVWFDDYAEIDLFLRQQWQDSRLAYELDPREGIDEIRLPSDLSIWTPGTYFMNAKEKTDANRAQFFVEPSGFVRSSESKTIYLPLTYGASFPFLGERAFKMKISSFSYSVEDVLYAWPPNSTAILPVEVSEDLLKYDISFDTGECIGNYTFGVYHCIDAEVSLNQSSLCSFHKHFLPSILLVIASWFHFWIHGSWSVPRSASAAGPFLLLAALFFFGTKAVPSAASSFWCWHAFCLWLTFFSLLEYFIVILCGVRRSVRYVNKNIHAEDHPLNPGNEVLETVYDGKCAAFRNNNGIDVISRILFPVVFLIWCILFFFVF